MNIKRIYLIGFRATGKSSFGRLLAQKIGFSFYDLDFLITEKAGKSADVLTSGGSDWRQFRKIENEVLNDTLELENAVISCGGGVGVNDVAESGSKTYGDLNREFFTKTGGNLVILLTASNKTIEERLRRQFVNNKIMPYLNPKNVKDGSVDSIEDKVKDSMQALGKRREKYQEFADFEIDTSLFELPEYLGNLYTVIGDPVSHSLSPKMHNTAFKALSMDKHNLFIACRVKEGKIKKFLEAAKLIGFKGISVTLPLKERVIPFLDKTDEVALKIGAVNTIINRDGMLKGFNTDWIGAVRALEESENLKDKKVAVIGAGGAARAVIYGLKAGGSRVTVFNRTVDRAKELAEEFDIDYGGLDSDKIKESDIIINTTTVGMNENQSPVGKNLINSDQVVMDIIFSPRNTELIKTALEKGARVIYGYKMLLYQGMEQFKIYTGMEAPAAEMEKVLNES
jgi:shikimate dehydrogenase